MKNSVHFITRVAIAALVFLSIFALSPIVYAQSLQCSESFNTSEIFIEDMVDVEGQTFSCIKCNSLDRYGITATPELPARYVSYALPLSAKNVTISDISYHVVSEHFLKYKLMPAQEPVPSDGSSIGFTKPDSQAYAKIGYNAPVILLNLQNGFDLNKVAIMAITPVLYSPGEDCIKVIDKLSFSITYESSGATKLASAKQQCTEFISADIEVLKKAVRNPENVDASALGTNLNKMQQKFSPSKGRKYVGDSLPAYEYCIITNAELAPAFERLAALKRTQGFDAGIVLIEDILKDSHFSQGDNISNIKDDAGCLRQYLKESWSKTKYALLGGKPPIVPIRYGTAGNYLSLQDMKKMKFWREYIIPTDYYFAEFENNWNEDGDDLFGEQKDEFQYGVRKIYVGRLLCTTPEQVNNYIDKLEFYEMNPGNGDSSYLSNSYIYFTKEMASANNVTYNGQVYSLNETKILPYISALHSNQITRYEGDVKTNGAEVISDLSSTNYHFWDIHGHGSPEGVNLNKNESPYYGVNALDSEPGALQIENANGLDNIHNFGYPYYSYSMSCTLMPFDSPKFNGYGSYKDYYDCLSMNFGESFTLGKNYGGVAFLGNTRSGYIGYSAYLEGRFFNYLNIPSLTSYEIGRSDNYSKSLTAAPVLAGNAYVNHAIQLAHNILGDPQLRIWNPQIVQHKTFSAIRRKNQILISCKNSQWNEPSNGRTAIVIEPDGTIHKKKFIDSVLFDSVSVNSSCSVYGMGDFTTPLEYILQNINIERSNYIYCSTATIGSNIYKFESTGNVVIKPGVEFIIDATDEVLINPGTIVKNGAILKIITPKSCHIENIVIEDGGKVEIYAKKLTANTVISQYQGTKLGAYKYNKYGVLEDGSLEIEYITSVNKAKTAVRYAPMFEVGKTWNYTLANHTMISSEPDKNLTIRIDGIKTIDDKEYYVANAYYDDNSEPVPFACFREDVENKQVYCLIESADSYQFFHLIFYKDFCPQVGPEYLLYDFGDHPLMVDDSYTLNDSFELEYNNRIFHGFIDKGSMTWGGSTVSILQELGLILLHRENDGYAPLSDCPYNLLGILAHVSGPMGWIPLLYEVKSPDGTVIFSLPDNKNSGLSEIETETAETRIEVGANSIEIAGKETLGCVSLINMQGVEVYHRDCKSNTLSISTYGIPKGIYVLRADGFVKKLRI